MFRAGNGTRTRDPNLGKVVLYQLSYSRARRKLADPRFTDKGNSRLPRVRGRAAHSLRSLRCGPASRQMHP
jgi:hypothetical protein